MRQPLSAAGRVERTGDRAFTMIELTVVIAIIAIVVALAVPRFASMISAQEEQLAVNLLSVAMRTGRDAALRSGGDQDAAVVFFYRPANQDSPSGGRLVMVPCVKIGSFVDDPRRAAGGVLGANSTDVEGLERDVFMPVEGVEPIVLPRNWTVRGYAPPNSIHGVATLEPGDPREGWYEGPRYVYTDGNWLFPETDFYDHNDDQAGANRQTFMIRFRAGTGEVVTGATTPAVVVDVRPYYNGRNPQASKLLYDAYDKTALVHKVLRQATSSRQLLLGRSGNSAPYSSCSDVVLSRPVALLALADERRLAAALVARNPAIAINPESGCLYLPPPPVPGAPTPNNPAVPTLVQNVSTANINEWIEGDTNFDGMVEGANGADHPYARVFALDHYSGVPRQLEVQP